MTMRGQFFPHMVIRKFPQRGFLFVNVKMKLPPGGQHASTRGNRRLGGRRMVQHSF